MARDYGLPQAVIDIIRQHHGSTLVSYFYCRATENGHAEAVDRAPSDTMDHCQSRRKRPSGVGRLGRGGGAFALNNPTKGALKAWSGV